MAKQSDIEAKNCPAAWLVVHEHAKRRGDIPAMKRAETELARLGVYLGPQATGDSSPKGARSDQ